MIVSNALSDRDTACAQLLAERSCQGEDGAAHPSRGVLTVDLDGPWRLYANRLPATGIALGTVTTARGETGALVYIERTGVYVRLNAGCMISLPLRKIQAAIDAARKAVGGRPHIMRDLD